MPPLTPSNARKKPVDPAARAFVSVSRAGASCWSIFKSVMPSCSRSPISPTTVGFSSHGCLPAEGPCQWRSWDGERWHTLVLQYRRVGDLLCDSRLRRPSCFGTRTSKRARSPPIQCPLHLTQKILVDLLSFPSVPTMRLTRVHEDCLVILCMVLVKLYAR